LDKVTLKRGPERGSSALIVSILSGRGAVGKSIIALNLADRLANGGKRVLLVDADLQSGNQHVLANADCIHGLSEFSDQQLPLRDSVTPLRPGLDLLGGLRNGGSLDPDSESDAQRLLRELRIQSGHYEFVIVDHSSGVSPVAQAIAGGSDLDLIVLVPELSSIADAFGLLKQLKKTNRWVDCRLLVNRTKGTEEAEHIYGRFSALAERFLRTAIPFAGFVPEDKVVRQSVAAQTVLGALAEGSAILEAFDTLTFRLITEFDAAPMAATQSNKTSINRVPITADMRE
jgi:flagellar biosynthesis protein FlhG